MGNCHGTAVWSNSKIEARKRVRPNNRPEYPEETTPSGVRNGGTWVPMLKSGKLYPPGLTAHQFHLRHCALLENRFADLYGGTVYCPVVARALTAAESSVRRLWHLRGLLGPDMFSDAGVRQYTAALPAEKMHLKGVAYLLEKFLGLYRDRPLFDPVARRHLTGAEVEGRLEWHIQFTCQELYSDDVQYHNLAVLDDARFPAGALP